MYCNSQEGKETSLAGEEYCDSLELKESSLAEEEYCNYQEGEENLSGRGRICTVTLRRGRKPLYQGKDI